VNYTCGFTEAPIQVLLLFTTLSAVGFRLFTTEDLEIQPMDIPITLFASVGHSTRFPFKNL
jgi:hypothetical protein